MKGSLQYFRNQKKDTEGKVCRLEQHTRRIGKGSGEYFPAFSKHSTLT